MKSGALILSPLLIGWAFSTAVMLESSSATVRKVEMNVAVVVASDEIGTPLMYLSMLCSIGTVETPLISGLVVVVPVVVVSGAVVSGVVVSVAVTIASFALLL